MDFSGLVKGVQDFWQFIWPPVICLVLLAGIPALLAPSVLTAGLVRLERLWPDSPHQVRLFKLFKRFGVDKLVPVITAFVLIFLLDVLRNSVLFTGGMIPPNISFSPDRLLLAHASDREVRTLWFKTGKPDDLSQFNRLIEIAVSDAETAHKGKALQNMHYWSERAARDYSAFSASKFFLLWSMAFCVVGIRKRQPGQRPFLRGLVAILLLTLAAGVFCMRFVYATEQSFYAQTQLADVILSGTPPDCLGSDNPCAVYERMTEAMAAIPSYHAARWWFITETDVTTYFRWLWQQAKNQLG